MYAAHNKATLQQLKDFVQALASADTSEPVMKHDAATILAVLSADTAEIATVLASTDKLDLVRRDTDGRLVAGSAVSSSVLYDITFQSACQAAC